MNVRIFTLSTPEGTTKDANALPGMEDVLAEMEANGFYRGHCPCCTKRIVVRYAGERTTMSAGDEHFLLHGSQPQ